MGGAPPGMDSKQMCDQMKNMTPEQMRAGMNQAQGQMGAQKQYVYSGALQLKSSGNAHIQTQEYAKALESYDRAIENLRPHSGDDVKVLRLQLLSNAALCHLKGNNFRKAMDVCEEALKLDPKAVKPMFRRGLAHEGMGDFSEALLDVKEAHNLSPSDKAVETELQRLRKLAKEKGINEEDLKPKAPTASASSSAGSAPKSFGPGDSLSSSKMPNNDDMKQAMDQIGQNPEMFNQAADMMKNMSPEEISRMMPGADPATVKKQFENPEMMKTAMDRMQSMPEAERQKMFEAASKMRESGGSPGVPGMPPGADMSSMSSVFENPEMMQHVAEMARHQEGVDPEQAAMMRQAAEQIQQNPELGKQMSEMVKNMDPEQMQKMMAMSANMRGGMSQGSDGPGGSPGGMPGGMPDAEQFLNDPQMMKAAEDMMKNMSPETLSAMAKSSGIDLDENKAKMIGKMMPYMPYVLKCMRAFGFIKRGFKSIFSPRGKMAIAVIVLSVAVYQYNTVYASG